MQRNPCFGHMLLHVEFVFEIKSRFSVVAVSNASVFWAWTIAIVRSTAVVRTSSRRLLFYSRAIERVNSPSTCMLYRHMLYVCVVCVV